eukprot:6375354-Pyramimonas_sp.AAC.1
MTITYTTKSEAKAELGRSDGHTRDRPVRPRHVLPRVTKSDLCSTTITPTSWGVECKGIYPRVGPIRPPQGAYTRE